MSETAILLALVCALLAPYVPVIVLIARQDHVVIIVVVVGARLGARARRPHRHLSPSRSLSQSLWLVGGDEVWERVGRWWERSARLSDGGTALGSVDVETHDMMGWGTMELRGNDSARQPCARRFLHNAMRNGLGVTILGVGSGALFDEIFSCLEAGLRGRKGSCRTQLEHVRKGGGGAASLPTSPVCCSSAGEWRKWLLSRRAHPLRAKSPVDLREEDLKLGSMGVPCPCGCGRDNVSRGTRQRHLDGGGHMQMKVTAAERALNYTSRLLDQFKRKTKKRPRERSGSPDVEEPAQKSARFGKSPGLVVGRMVQKLYNAMWLPMAPMCGYDER
ncbi:hypothetical protein DFH08DRAFT_821322 [Mycena albidolilacea]|uniref:Uncharacterized protein n=1 Tax=Mycena albidolilacea TaxID=1033008 RepID=A0AAD6ZAN5_9AGAR|nr:hypothetical protein DFH08DRAFT_821322 [Mycena albidolilacea]